MKYYGKCSMASFLKIMLDVLIVVGIGMIIVIAKNAFTSKGINVSITLKIFLSVLFSIGGICLIHILFNLKKIVNSLVAVNPFVRSNAKSLKTISIECFIIAGCYLLNFFINPNWGKLKLVVIDVKGIHTDFAFFIFFFAGCFILILSKVFEQAVEVKEENELTI
ncbi:DUF2975 domain-containing protein [Clostridium aestuarii]|uniref:DUF2975 domain-containing protein n=1 Tax=Clostridium aestuarii TaxID=338193 RepID=A0ABT4D0E4_9CLOT|nr:DUF2975 domain-containing protein [Clostridium aestuarii]MCY6484709.1 DUF2975 domain-containing protein [Clostridium aestuarii]